MKVHHFQKNQFQGFLLFGIILALCFYLCGCRKTVKIGFAAQLTGNKSELGIQERNGVQLAVDSINASGGIDGRQIELIIRDDLGTEEGAEIAANELMKSGVVAIIGHATSAQTISGLKITNPAELIMISPTASTVDLSGLDDHFFRVNTATWTGGHEMARHILESRRIDKIAIAFDTDNNNYCKSFLAAFNEKFKSLGGQVVSESGFSSKAKPDFETMVSRLRSTNPDGLLLVTSDADSALIAQRSRIIGWNVPLFDSGWAATETLVTTGGAAVEGMEFAQNYALDSNDPDWVIFKSRYESQFGRSPSFGAGFGYESAMILSRALKKNGGRREGLKKALLDIKDFKGLIGSISFDQYGDAVRSTYILTIHNATFVTVDVINPKQ